MSCRICNGTIDRGVCINCGSDEDAAPVERLKLSERDRKEMEGGPPIRLRQTGGSTFVGEQNYHGGQFHGGEW